MTVNIRMKNFRLFLPVPLTMAGFIVRWIPGRVFEEMRGDIPEPYRGLITKESIRMAVGECLDVLKECRGLEIIHVEAEDGTFISVKL